MVTATGTPAPEGLSVLYSEKTAEATIRDIVTEVDRVARCTFNYHPRTRAMLVMVGAPDAHAIVELSEQDMVSAFGLNTNPREIDEARRTSLKQQFETATRAARSAAAWAKGRYGTGLKKVTVAEYSVATRARDRIDGFNKGERMVILEVGNETFTLWRDAAGRMTAVED
jgi:hypothetical protein